MVAVGVRWWLMRSDPAAFPAATDADRRPATAPDDPAPVGPPPETVGSHALVEPDDDPVMGMGREAPRGPWTAVDLPAVQAAMPNNIYWTMSSPTRDPDLQRWREEERERWNLAYGKVLSNTATADEFQTYFAYRQRLSSDYVEFATHLLTHYGMQLPQRDAQMLKLAIELHLARLEELPRQITEANQRREAHDAARRTWLEDQKAFDPPPVTTP